MANSHPKPAGVPASTQEEHRHDDVPDNPFAFSPTQLSQLINPKSIEALTSFGGLSGLEKGLQTDRLAGLSVDETHVTKTTTLPEARASIGTGTEPGKPRPLERADQRS